MNIAKFVTYFFLDLLGSSTGGQRMVYCVAGVSLILTGLLRCLIRNCSNINFTAATNDNGSLAAVIKPQPSIATMAV